MRNVITRSTINRLVWACTIGAFTFSTISPLYAIPQINGINTNLNDINFGLRIEKLVKKAKKYFNDKNSNKLTEVMFDIKNEVEAYSGQKINLDHYILTK